MATPPWASHTLAHDLSGPVHRGLTRTLPSTVDGAEEFLTFSD
jgi:hypothetical protein